MASDNVPKHLRLTNVVEEDVPSHLPLPSLLAPTSPREMFLDLRVNQSDIVRDSQAIGRIHQLLQTADASYVKPCTPRQQAQAGTSLLEELILRRDPRSFQSCPSGSFTQQISAQPVQKTAPAIQLNLSKAETAACQVRPVSQEDGKEDNGAFVRQAKRQRRSHIGDQIHVDVVAPEHSFKGDVNQILVSFLGDSGAAPHTDGTDENNVETEAELRGDFEGIERAIANVQSLSDKLDPAVAHLWTADVKHLRAVLRVLRSYMNAGKRECLATEDEEESPAFQAIILSLESAIACLKLMAAPNMPKQIYDEDLIEIMLDTAKLHLMNNVLVFYDARLRQLHRPTLYESDGERSGPTRGKKRKSAGIGMTLMTQKVSSLVKRVKGRLEKLILQLTDLLSIVQLPAGMVLTLLRQASQCLTVDGLDIMQVGVVGLLVAGFTHYEAQRSAILEDLLSGILPNLAGAKGKLGRTFMISGQTGGAILMFSALFLQILQFAITLPSISTDAKALRNSFAPATHYADMFWAGLFDRLPSRGSKNDTETDVRNLLEQILQDICSLLSLPEWPAAATALLRLINTLGSTSGLYNNDNAVRQASVDMLGTIAARVFMEAYQGEKDEEYLRECLLQEVEGSTLNSVLKDSPYQDLLLQFLCDRRHTANPLQHSAVTFILCRAFVEALTHHQKQELPEDEQHLLLTQFRELETLLKRGTTSDISEEEAIQLSRAVMHSGPLGRGRQTLLKWLLDAADPLKQAPTTRAKAMKALSLVLHSDGRVAKLQEVQAGISRALKDDAASVRQQAVDLLGSSIQRDRELVETYFDTLVSASKDPSSTSVRKAALKILHENCIKVAGSPYATDACVAVLQRVVDHEESMHDFVARVAHELWLSDSTDDDGRSSKGTVAERAEQLAQVAQAMYFAGGTAIHLPLELSHPLIVVLKKALQREVKGTNNRVSRAGQQVADALLEGVLQAFDSTGSNTLAFPYLVALHAFSLTDAQLCLSSDDPGRFLRCLAPYLKVSKPEVYAGLAPQQRCLLERREAEQILCILSILASVFECLDSTSGMATPDLQVDLRQLINQHPYTQVVSSACKTLAALAKHQPSAAKVLSALFGMYLSKLQEQRAFDFKGKQTTAAICARFLYVMGHLVRYGADVIEAVDPSGPEEPLLVQQCSEIIMDFFENTTVDLKVRASALQALGSVFIARPTCMFSERARKLQMAVLQRKAEHDLKIRALNNLADLLKAEEHRLVLKQEDTLDENGQKGDGLAEQENAPLATINGQTDVLTSSSTILQDQWSLVLELATDTTPQGDLGDARNANVRRQAIVVVEAVYRNGLVAPWLGVPTLVALTTDPCSDVAARALKVLKRLAEKEPHMFQAGLAEGLSTAADFQARLQSASGSSCSGESGAADEVIRGISSLYAELVQPNRTFRTAFIGKLLKKFDTACNLHSNARTDMRLLSLIAHVAASLPFKKGDELLTLIFQIDAIVARRGDDVVASFGDAVKQSEQVGADGARNEGLKANRLLAEVNASLALSMLLMVKEYLKLAYGITSERIAAFHPNQSEKRKVEERMIVARNNNVPLKLSTLNLNASLEAAELRTLYKIVSSLLRDDATEHVSRAPAAAGEEMACEGTPRANQDGGGSTPFVLYTMAQKQAASRGSRGGRRGRGTGRGGRGGRSQKRRKKHVEDDDSIDDDGGGENDHDTGVKIGQPRRLEMNLGDQDPL